MSVKEKLKVGKILNIAEWVIIIIMAIVALALVLSKFDTPLKYRVFSVNSGSMQPAVKLGSLVFVRPQVEYFEGDVISYSGRRNPSMITTHRITQVMEDVDLGRIQYRTRGDANEDEDISLTNKSQVIGKVVFKVPLLGYLIAFAKTQLGFMLLIVIPATVIVYSELGNVKSELAIILAERKKTKKGKVASLVKTEGKKKPKKTEKAAAKKKVSKK